MFLLEHPIDPISFGIGCPHGDEAITIGRKRIDALLARKASKEELRAELDITDPLVVASYLVTLQHQMCGAYHGLKGVFSFRRYFGDSLSAGSEQLMAQLNDYFENLLDKWGERIAQRCETLHDENGELVPWHYPDDGGVQKSEKKTVQLSPQDDATVMRLLSGLGGWENL